MPTPESIRRRVYQDALRAAAHAVTARTHAEMHQASTVQRLRECALLISGAGGALRSPSNVRASPTAAGAVPDGWAEAAERVQRAAPQLAIDALRR